MLYPGGGPVSLTAAQPDDEMLRLILILSFVLRAIGVQELEYACPSKSSGKGAKFVLTIVANITS